MASLSSPLLILLFLFSSVSSISTDAEILIRVKTDQISDPDNRLLNWVITHLQSPCHWTGILCNSNSSVISINLQNLGLSGQFPFGFCRVRTLRNLSISDNNFVGKISSSSLSLCSQLHSLNISSNYFIGKLPDFSPEFTSLKYVDFAYNNFSGDIPDSYGDFPTIRVLRLFDNCLTGSAFPEFLTRLTELTHLELAYNPFHPTRIPLTVSNLSNLKVMWFTETNLVGPIPWSICKLKSLKNLDLAGNSLSGEIPTCIGNLSKLVQLEIYKNQLSGELPESLGDLKNLLYFDASENSLIGNLPEKLAGVQLISLNLNDNKLSGKIPEVLALNKNLYQLKLFNNSFSGELPQHLGLNSKLNEFDVSTNNFSGYFPINLCYGKQLEVLVAFNNHFSGSFSESYGKCSSLVYLRIENNNFSGEFPCDIWKLPQLNHILVSNNKFEGTLPPSISTSVTKLLLSRNRFSGVLTFGLCRLSKLSDLDLSMNQFSGEFPKCLTRVNSLEKINFHENMLSGVFPYNVSSWVHLTLLNLSRNQFSGEIPNQLGDLPVLAYLDLSNNSFTGEIPTELTKLKLYKFNVSYNKLEGQVPWGFNHGSYLYSLLGNPNLCSSDLKPLPSCPKPKLVYISIVIALTIAALVFLSSLLWLYKTKLGLDRSKDYPCTITTFQQLNLTEKDIFPYLTESNLVGSGGSGRVYRVALQPDQVVAVKKLWDANKNVDTGRVFESEVKTLGGIRHKNIIKLLFTCIGEGHQVLGYEYMVNGSLGDVLHGEDGGALLGWPKRFAIAVGAAQGLAYLHHDCKPPIIHRDVKSSNILLDEEFLPKVADFGLAKLLVGCKGSVSRHSVEAMSNIAGSCGYIAPEYGYTLKVTEKSDVYSFGVVLMELVLGKRPNHSCFGESNDIVKWTASTWLESQESNDVIQFVDQRMDPAMCNYNEIKKVIELAILCTSTFPMNRPSMRRVVELLRSDAPIMIS